MTVSKFEPKGWSDLMEQVTPQPVTAIAADDLFVSIKSFEESTSASEQVGVMLASFGQSITLRLSAIATNGHFFIFKGNLDNGSYAELVQHYTQTSILLTKIELEPEQIKRPIGFY